jgi:predicted esterase
MRKLAICLLLLPLASALFAQEPRTIKVWPGKAPGSENWSFAETVRDMPGGGKSYSNVVEPTLTAYLPDPAKATGPAVILCPGGGMRTVNFPDAEPAVKYLNARGIAAFILKYRVVPSTAPAAGGPPAGGPPAGGRGARPAGPPAGSATPQRNELSLTDILNRNGNSIPSAGNEEQEKVIAMAIADGQQAIRLVRQHAAEYHIDPKRVGIIGYSAGAAPSIGSALAEPGDAYPDFVGSVFAPSLTEVRVPKHGAPLFIAVMDSHFNVTNGCTALFALWKEAGRPVEMHVYDHANGPGSGMPVASWLDRLYDWLVARKIAWN